MGVKCFMKRQIWNEISSFMEHSTRKKKLQLKNISIKSWDMSRTEIENVLVAGVADN